MSSERDGGYVEEIAMMFIGVFGGLLLALGPANCAVQVAACQGFAAGSGQECVRDGSECLCADALTPSDEVQP